MPACLWPGLWRPGAPLVELGLAKNHIGAAEGWVRDGRAEGFVLIWPASDPSTQTQILAELSDSLSRHAPGANEAEPPAPALP